jgi:hypothetical protein
VYLGPQLYLDIARSAFRGLGAMTAKVKVWVLQDREVLYHQLLPDQLPAILEFFTVVRQKHASNIRSLAIEGGEPSRVMAADGQPVPCRSVAQVF